MNKYFRLKACLIAGFMILSFSCFATDLHQRKSELKAIQAKINQEQTSFKRASEHSKKLQNLLRKDEEAIAKVATTLNNTRDELAKIDKELNQLKGKKKQLNQQKKHQQDILTNQLTSAYLIGNHDYTKMLLSQQNPTEMDRLLIYYQYFNRARIKAIDALKQTLTELDTLTAQEQKRRLQLNELQQRQTEQATLLNQEQSQREKTLTQLQRNLISQGEKLEQLQIEEASIRQILQKAVEAAKNTFNMDGLRKNKGKLSWPTQGKLLAPFGSNRAGGVTWKGVLLSAPEGQDVRAIAAGEVIYADWLKGFGMVMVVDHGKGYMSLYGHAQALLKPVGTKIKKGESIALVGRSGGQLVPSLYFEIRRKGKAVNPATYCR